MDEKLNRLVIAQTAITCQKLLKLVDPRRSHSVLHQCCFFSDTVYIIMTK